MDSIPLHEHLAVVNGITLQNKINNSLAIEGLKASIELHQNINADLQTQIKELNLVVVKQQKIIKNLRKKVKQLKK